MSDRPMLVSMGEALRAAHQDGSDVRMMQVMGGPTGGDGLLAELGEAIVGANERTLTYSAPQVADLAIRLGWLLKEQERG